MEAVSQITIILDAAGRVHVNGQIENKLLAYGMLESAKDAIRDYVKKQSEGSGIVTLPPGFGLPKS